jgi:predicted MPP superfamily phosphohydrolase
MRRRRLRFTRRAFLRSLGGCAVGALSLGADGYAYGRLLEPNWLDVARVEVVVPGLAGAFDGYRIAQISDIHLDNDWMTRERLGGVVRAINQQAPDLVAITGDFVTGGALEGLLPILRDELKRVRAPDGVVAVLGNHDHWSGPEPVRGALRDAAITELGNAVVAIERRGAALQVAGVDDHWEGQDRLDLVLRRLSASAPAILLAHEPDFADTSAATGRFALQLSGHSHGGQISLPLLGPPLLPPFGVRYPRGRYQVGGMVQYTNRGVGMLRPYGRLNCQPEITLLHLRTPGV